MSVISQLLADVQDLRRRLANVSRVGTIEEVDYTAARVKVRLEEKLLSGWLPWLTQRAGGDVTWWAPEVGEQVLLTCPMGELNQAYVTGSVYQTSVPAPDALETKRVTKYADGAVISYDRTEHVLSAVLPAGATAELTADGGITLTGDVSITGNLTATGDVADSGGPLSRLRTKYNTHTHIGNLGSPTSPADAQDA